MPGCMSKPWNPRPAQSPARRAQAWLPSLATLALGFVLVLAYSSPPRSVGAAAGGAILVEDFEAVRVIDGDTIRYRGDRIRLADINTPEVSRPSCASEAELGARATERLEALLAAGPFTLLPSADGRDEDVYGRKLRIAARDGRSLGSTLVEEGLAHEWRGYKESWCDG